MALFFKQPAHRRFEMKPRYWDPVAEAKKEREKRVRAELGLPEDGNEYIHDVKAGLRREYNKRKAVRKNGMFNYSLRLFMVLMILLLAAFYLFSYKLEAILRLFNY